MRRTLPRSLWLAGVVSAAARAADGAEAPPLFSDRVWTMVWTIAVFGVLLVVLKRFVWGPLLDTLQRRERFVESSIASARNQQREAEARLKEYTDKLAVAGEEAQAIVADARRDAEAMCRRMSEESAAEARKLLDDAQEDIRRARDRAIKQIHDHAADLAAEAAGQILQREISADRHRELIGEAIEGLGQLGEPTDEGRFG